MSMYSVNILFAGLLVRLQKTFRYSKTNQLIVINICSITHFVRFIECFIFLGFFSNASLLMDVVILVVCCVYFSLVSLFVCLSVCFIGLLYISVFFISFCLSIYLFVVFWLSVCSSLYLNFCVFDTESVFFMLVIAVCICFFLFVLSLCLFVFFSSEATL